MGNRHGKRKEGQVLIGVFVPVRKKALMIVTASAISGHNHNQPVSQGDLIWMGVETLATVYGVIDKNGNLNPDYEVPLQIAERMIRENHDKDRGRVGGSRKRGK